MRNGEGFCNVLYILVYLFLFIPLLGSGGGNRGRSVSPSNRVSTIV